MTTGGQEGALRMNDGEFRRFAQMVRSHCGLCFTQDTRFLLEKRILRRMRELSITNFAAYHYELRSDPRRDGEMAQLIDELTTNETYFFRERGQLVALVGEILPEAIAARRESGGGPVTIWSAGCASGEEPYSVAMLAREQGIDPETELRIYASDISRRMLRRARAGRYRESSFRETEPELRRRYFSEQEGLWTIGDDVRKCVDFIHLNLMDRSKIALLGSMDVVLCRNVIIYFDAEGKRDAIRTFEEKLRPGGHLLLGHSESLINVSTSLELRHLTNDLVYRRPLPSLGRDSWHRAAAAAIGSDDEAP